MPAMASSAVISLFRQVGGERCCFRHTRSLFEHEAALSLGTRWNQPLVVQAALFTVSQTVAFGKVSGAEERRDFI